MVNASDLIGMVPRNRESYLRTYNLVYRKLFDELEGLFQQLVTSGNDVYPHASAHSIFRQSDKAKEVGALDWKSLVPESTHVAVVDLHPNDFRKVFDSIYDFKGVPTSDHTYRSPKAEVSFDYRIGLVDMIIKGLCLAEDLDIHVDEGATKARDLQVRIETPVFWFKRGHGSLYKINEVLIARDHDENQVPLGYIRLLLMAESLKNLKRKIQGTFPTSLEELALSS